MNYGRKSEHYALERHPWKHRMIRKIMLKILNNAQFDKNSFEDLLNLPSPIPTAQQVKIIRLRGLAKFRTKHFTGSNSITAREKTMLTDDVTQVP